MLPIKSTKFLSHSGVIKYISRNAGKKKKINSKLLNTNCECPSLFVYSFRCVQDLKGDRLRQIILNFLQRVFVLINWMTDISQEPQGNLHIIALHTR